MLSASVSSRTASTTRRVLVGFHLTCTEGHDLDPAGLARRDRPPPLPGPGVGAGVGGGVGEGDAAMQPIVATSQDQLGQRVALRPSLRTLRGSSPHRASELSCVQFTRSTLAAALATSIMG